MVYFASFSLFFIVAAFDGEQSCVCVCVCVCVENNSKLCDLLTPFVYMPYPVFIFHYVNIESNKIKF